MRCYRFQSRLMSNSRHKRRNYRCIEHFVELQLIEVMKMKVQMIQFVSIVNLIQMKLMKVIDNLKNIPNKKIQHSME
jgi:hypothetical protein